MTDIATMTDDDLRIALAECLGYEWWTSPKTVSGYEDGNLHSCLKSPGFDPHGWQQSVYLWQKGKLGIPETFRLSIFPDWPRDHAAALSLGAIMRERGLHHRYCFSLTAITGDTFGLLHLAPRQRAEAALKVLQEAKNET